MYDKALLFQLAIIVIARSMSGQWALVGSVTGAGPLPSISVPAPDVVVIAGGYTETPAIFLSTNGGSTFSTLSTSGMMYEIMAVWAMNRDTIFVGDAGMAKGGDARAFRTYNSGTVWTNILTPGGFYSFFDGVVFSKPYQQFGIAVSDPPFGFSFPFWIAKTTNAGATWSTGSAPGGSNSGALPNSVYCIDSMFYGFGINGGPPRVTMTTDGGISWNIRSLSASGMSVTSVAFCSDKLCGLAAVYSNSLVYRTTDGGLTWSQVSIGSGVSGYLNLKWIYGSEIVYLTGSVDNGGAAKRSSDGGLTWTQMTTDGVSEIRHFEYFKASQYTAYLYAVSSTGSVIRYVDNELSGIKSISSNIPSDFALYQNYPNPFNPTSKIKFDLPDNSEQKTSTYKLIIYDVLGTEITTLINQLLSPGIYEIEWDASGYPSGVYFYQLSSEKYTDTKKLIILK